MSRTSQKMRRLFRCRFVAKLTEMTRASWNELEEIREAESRALLHTVNGPGTAEYWALNSTVGYDVDPFSLMDATVVTLPGLSSMIMMAEPRQDTYIHLLDAIAQRKAVANTHYTSHIGPGGQEAIIVRLGGSGIQEESWIPTPGSCITIDASDSFEHRDPYIKDKKYSVSGASCKFIPGLNCNVTEMYLEPSTTSIHHYDYLGWPDGGLPSDKQSFDNLVAHVADVRAAKPSAGTQIHCHAGLGRSGVFAASLAQLEARRRGSMLPRAPLVKTIREQRYGAVQTWEQYSMLSEFGQ